MGNFLYKTLAGVTSADSPIALPANAMGTFKRFKISHDLGSPLTLRVYNRKAAVVGQADLHVLSGKIASVEAHSAGFVVVTTTEPHLLNSPSDIEFLWTDDPTLNGVKEMHPTLGIPSDTTFVVAHNSNVATTGVWQERTNPKFISPFVHEIFSTSVTTTSDSNTEIDYVTSDNPSPNSERRSTQLWAGLFNGSGDLEPNVNYEIMYLIEQPVLG